jgi:prepilin-type N-terminal cleavage/methylation domain-containing protein
VGGSAPRGVTLIELLIAITITSMLSVVLGGLVMAVQSAREHTEGLEEATAQAQAALERIKYMVSQAGVYEIDSSPTALGLAVVSREWSTYSLPQILVVWSGGREGGMADAGTQTRLPVVNELVIYTYDPDDPQRLVELVVEDDSSDIDFTAAGFADTVLALIESESAEKLLLCDRLRRSVLAGAVPFSDPGVGHVFFEIETLPSDDSIAAATPGTSDWNGLLWSQGVVSSDSGMRQATLRMEVQVEPHRYEVSGAEDSPIAIPFFGSASYRYVYHL